MVYLAEDCSRRPKMKLSVFLRGSSCQVFVCYFKTRKKLNFDLVNRVRMFYAPSRLSL